MAREMKDSGIEWIGKIPQEWDIKKGKWILKLLERPITETDGVITCFRNGEVTLRSKRREEGFTISLKEIGYQGVDEGDLVVHGMDGFAGAIGISDSRGKGSPVLNVLGSDQCKKYIMYYLRSMAYNGIFLALSTGIRVRSCDTNWNKLKELLYILPKTSEQQLIANFLDTRCAHIDSVIEKTRAAVEEYKKLKQAVITQAVTKGIRPNREIKDSGIEWIGEIPREWKSIKLKHRIALIESGVSVNAGQNPVCEDNIGVLKTSSVSKYWFNPQENKEVNEDEIKRVSCPVVANTLIVSRMNTPDLVGACGFVDKDYPNLFLPDRLWQVHFQDKTNVKYLWYFLNSKNVRFYYASLAVGTSSSMQNISQDQFYNTYVTLPPLQEQSEIVSYLDEKNAAIDSIILKKEQLITELEAYKKSLIYEYVTGKKEVSDNETIALSLDFQIALLICNILKNTDVKGRIHLQKVIFALDTLLGLFSGTQYYRYPHGPYDLQIEKYESIIVKQGWVVVDKSKGYVRYTKTDKFMEFESLYQDVFKERDKDIRKICNLFNVKRTSKAEKMATLLASWNDFLIDGVAPTDDMIINDIVTNWTVNKANIAKETWREELRQLKEKQLIPKGYGKHTLKKEQNDYAH